MSPALSVVVCAYTMDRWQDLVDALASLHTQRTPADEVLLVVDHCPELAARARGFAPWAGVRILESAGPRGLSGARNTGLATACGQIVAFLDDDAVAEPDWSARLLAAYAHPRVVGVGGRAVPRWDGGRPDWFPPEFDWVIGCSHRGLPETVGPVRNLIGACMSFHREPVLAAGGFRDGLGRVGARPLGCEETELCLRLVARDPEALLLYEPRAVVRHHVPASRANWRYFRARCWSEGLSKAAVARLAGRGPALSAERAYLTRTLPRAAVASPRHAPALAVGTATTLLGYAAGRLGRRAT